MARKTTPSFIHTFELQPFGVKQGSFRDLEISAEFYRKLYNALLGQLYATAQEMKESKEWEDVRKLPRKTEEDLQIRSELFEDLKESYRLTKNDAEKLAKKLVAGSKDFIQWTNSAVVQKVAERAMRAVDRWIRGKAKRLRFKRKGSGFNFEGKSNQTGVRIVERDKHFVCLVSKRKYALSYSIDNVYDVHALSSRCKYARILFKKIRGKQRIFVQGVFEGIPLEDKEKQKKHLQKLIEREGSDYLERKQEIPSELRERVAYDIGPKNIAIATPLTSYERPLCGGVDSKQKEIRRLQRALDRSRRKSNPSNYYEDGRVVKGSKSWTYSKSYIKKRTYYGDLERRKSAERKSSHGNLCNDILSYGNSIHTEKVSVKGWQKRWGRSIAHHSPSALTSELTRKAEYARGRLEKISTQETALSQHCICGHRKKKKLSERVHLCEVCGFKAKRDSLSAYLAIFCERQKMGEEASRWQIDFASAVSCLKGHRTLSLNVQHDVVRLMYQPSEQKTAKLRVSLPIATVG